MRSPRPSTMSPPSSRTPPLVPPSRAITYSSSLRAIGSFLFGYDSGIISSVISTSYDQFQAYFDKPGPNITGAIVSVFAGGAFCMPPTVT